jgi:hypothetical protein
MGLIVGNNVDRCRERFETFFEESCALTVSDDGLRLDPASVKVERIQEDQDSEGIRVIFLGHLKNPRLPEQIDIGPKTKSSKCPVSNGPKHNPQNGILNSDSDCLFNE